MGYALSLLALHLRHAAEAARILEEIGHTGTEAARIRAMFNLNSRQAQSLLAEFGLSPTSATRIAGPYRHGENRFSKLLPRRSGDDSGPR